MIRITQLFKSIRHAVRGVRVVYTSEQSFRIQIYVATLVLVAGILFGVRTLEWVLLIFLIGAVLTLELVNSIFERMVDSFKPRIHPIVKDIKDIMAGTVLIVSMIATIIGLTIFYPHVVALVSALA